MDWRTNAVGIVVDDSVAAVVVEGVASDGGIGGTGNAGSVDADVGGALGTGAPLFATGASVNDGVAEGVGRATGVTTGVSDNVDGAAALGSAI